jgi:cytochrome c peroxidase
MSKRSAGNMFLCFVMTGILTGLMFFQSLGAAGLDEHPAETSMGLPPLPVPADNPLTPAKIELGEKLFFETGLSEDHSISCSSCHKPEHFFADPVRFSKGVRGQPGDRNAVSILNAAYVTHLLWDGRSVSLEDQVRYPVTHPREMNNAQDKVVKFLAASAEYPPLFQRAFGDGPISWDRVAKAIASFERTLVSANSPFDRYMSGNQAAISKAAQRGFELFRGKAACVNCHTYSQEHPFFSDFEFHNTGVGWEGTADLGRYEISKAREDKGAFRTPSLRNVAMTAPYMHDGHFASLSEVVDYYARGGEHNPFLDEKIKPLALTDEDKKDLVEFLLSLTGEMTYKPRPAVQAVLRPAAVQQKAGPPASPGDDSELRDDQFPRSYPPFGRVEIVAGSSDFGDGGKAMDALFVGIGGLAVDRKGNIYIADSGGNSVRKIDGRTGLVTTIAGNRLLFGRAGARLATEQALHGPTALALDDQGRYLYIADTLARKVQRLDLSNGEMRDLGAPPAGFAEPSGVAYGPQGLLVGDAPRGQVWKLELDGSWSELLPERARVRGGIRTLSQDSRGRVYMAEYFFHRVQRWDPATKRLEIVAGTGEAGRVADGAQGLQSPLRTPVGMAFDREGNLVLADKGNHRICKVDSASGLLKTLVEAGEIGTDERWTPGPIAFDSSGALWIADIQSNRLLRYRPGDAEAVVVAGRGNIRDGGRAVEARLAHPGAVATDQKGNIYISDTLHHSVRVVDPDSGRIRTVAGTGMPGYNGDDIPAVEARLSYPGKLQVDSHGRLYIGDYYNNRVRRVDPNGMISTVAGNGRAGEEGDDGPADEATLLNPHALLLDADKSLIIISAVSSRMRWVDLTNGKIHAVPLRQELPDTLEFYGITKWKQGLVLASPRPGSVDYISDGAISRLFSQPEVILPQDVAVSPAGELYICETGRNRILRLNGSTLEVVVENLGRPRSIAFDAKGNLLIADTFHNRVLRVWTHDAPSSNKMARNVEGPAAPRPKSF